MGTHDSPWGKRLRRSFVSALLVVLVLASCASVGKPQGPNDTLLIIPVVFKMAPGADRWIYYYALEFEGLQQPVIVSPTGGHFVAASGVPAGKYTLRGITLVPIGSNNYRNSVAVKRPAPEVVVETRERTATMAPFLIESLLEEVGQYTYSQRYGFRQLQENEKQLVIAELQKQDNFAAWENALGQ